MGNELSSLLGRRFRVSVTTGDLKRAGTDANVYLVLYDENNQPSKPLKLNKPFHNDLERGKTDEYTGPRADENFGTVSEIEIWRDTAGAFSLWYCQVIIVTDTHTGQSQAFPVQRWVKAGIHYRIPAVHTCLPQNDKYPDMRAEELKDKRREYEYEQKHPGLPVQVKELPEDEQFSDDYKRDLTKAKIEMLLSTKLAKFQVKSKWQRMDDIKELFTSKVFPEPKGVRYYRDDLWFAAQRLIGCNPTRITLCTELPDNFQVTNEMLSGILEGRSLTQALEEKKLFIVNHKIVEGLPAQNEENEFPAPMALFYLNNNNDLTPIAIQLQQKPGPENPIFLPSDPENMWMAAKMWFNMADAAVHQSITHLGFTHLLMESICVCTHRNLAVNHPVFRLLAPHFLFLLAINFTGLGELISPDGWVQKTMQTGVKGLTVLLERGLMEYDFEVNACLPKDLAARGVDSPDVLPVYPYRDDGMPVYNAIQSYVSRVLHYYYDSPDKLKNDHEIQAWGKELVAPRPNGGGLQGISSNGEFENVDDLVKVISCIIFNSSAQHAIHFVQYDEYAFPPNYPLMLNGKLPKNKDHVLTDEELVDMLPNKETTFDTMIITKLVSTKATKCLGDWEFRFQYDEPSLDAERLFREELGEISKQVAERNKTRNDMLKYEVLDPAQIPNSISI